MLGEDDMMKYCLQQVFRNGTFLSYYDEDKAFVFKDREKIMDSLEAIYEMRLFKSTPISTRYYNYLKEQHNKKIRERQTEREQVI
jgi:hypothetical protein